jgi:FeS assembly SUF system regulator|tara:strand:+ start:2812 stop:3258 length:447 start_codon:yes stop_codon:yes gene_type:complete
MLKISRMTDYGTIVLSQLNNQKVKSAEDISSNTNISKPTVSKLLKVFTQKGLTVSERGALGGYALARSSKKINIADIINAVEGPVAITQCNSVQDSCEIEHSCMTGDIWKNINNRISSVLSDVTLYDVKNNKKTSELNFYTKEEIGIS